MSPVGIDNLATICNISPFPCQFKMSLLSEWDGVRGCQHDIHRLYKMENEMHALWFDYATERMKKKLYFRTKMAPPQTDNLNKYATCLRLRWSDKEKKKVCAARCWAGSEVGGVQEFFHFRRLSILHIFNISENGISVSEETGERMPQPARGMKKNKYNWITDFSGSFLSFSITRHVDGERWYWTIMERHEMALAMKAYFVVYRDIGCQSASLTLSGFCLFSILKRKLRVSSWIMTLSYHIYFYSINLKDLIGKLFNKISAFSFELMKGTLLMLIKCGASQSQKRCE